jgi:hypothetical protein
MFGDWEGVSSPLTTHCYSHPILFSHVCFSSILLCFHFTSLPFH